MTKVGTLSKVSKYFYQNGESVVITSDIWERDPEYPKGFLPHVGYDYRAPIGTKIVAPFDGVVIVTVTALWSSYGRQIFILKEDGTVTVHFAHLSKVNVKNGDKVKQGDLIGLSGASGAEENTYAPHLHAGLAKGKVTTTTKGKALGDIWLDVEEFDFEPKLKLTDKEIAYEIVFGKNLWGDGQARKNALGNRWRSVQDEIELLLKNKPQTTTPKPPVFKPYKKVIAKGALLYNENGKAYGIKTTQAHTVTIDREKNGMGNFKASWLIGVNNAWVRL